MAFRSRKRKSSETEEQEPFENKGGSISGQLYRSYEYEEAVNVLTGTSVAKVVEVVDKPAVELTSTEAHHRTEFDMKDEQDVSTNDAQTSNSADTPLRDSVKDDLTEAVRAEGATKSHKCGILTEPQICRDLLGNSLCESVYDLEDPEVKSSAIPSGADSHLDYLLALEQGKGSSSDEGCTLNAMQGDQKCTAAKEKVRRRMGMWDFGDRERRNNCIGHFMGNSQRKIKSNGEGGLRVVEEHIGARKDEDNSNSGKGVAINCSELLASETAAHNPLLSDGPCNLDTAHEHDSSSIEVNLTPDLFLYKPLGSIKLKEMPSQPGSSFSRTVRELKYLSVETLAQGTDNASLALPPVKTTSKDQQNNETEVFMLKKGVDGEGEENPAIVGALKGNLGLEEGPYTMKEEVNVLDRYKKSPQAIMPSSARSGVPLAVTTGCKPLENVGESAIQLVSFMLCSAENTPGAAKEEQEDLVARTGATSRIPHKLEECKSRCLGSEPVHIGTNLLLDNSVAGDSRRSPSVEDVGDIRKSDEETRGVDLVTCTRNPPAIGQHALNITLEESRLLPFSYMTTKPDVHVIQVNCQNETQISSDPASIKGTNVGVIQQTDNEDKTDAPTISDLEAAHVDSSAVLIVAAMLPPTCVEDPLSLQDQVWDVSTEPQVDPLSQEHGRCLDACDSPVRSQLSLLRRPPTYTVPDHTVEVSSSLFSLSDSQLDSLTLSQVNEQTSYPTEEQEDATELLCGLIKELSSLNRTVMAAHRKLENLRRGSKTSRPPFPLPFRSPKH